MQFAGSTDYFHQWKSPSTNVNMVLLLDGCSDCVTHALRNSDLLNCELRVGNLDNSEIGTHVCREICT